MDQLRALRYFSKVAETGSFTRAADTFGVPPSSLSRRVAALEDDLGATLLKRTTRSVQLTEIGQLYYQQVQDILHQLEQSDEAVRSYQTKPMGQLRISAMTGFGERLLLPLLDEFKQLYPDIILDVSLSDAITKLGRDEVDIAIRGGYAPNERVQAIRLMENEFIPVASPHYLEKMGTPNNVLELKNHLGLFYRTPAGPSPWLCEINGEWRDVSGIPVAISNHGKWLAQLTTEGKGIMMAPRWSVEPYFENGQLQELHFNQPLRITQNPDMAIFLLYQKQQYVVPKVKVAVDFFVARLKDKW
ncbi:LysR family transcriptional regulator [Litoribrevibacter albus]|uniref:LysR family transcriptional regulator n=1 Tax=Litoribrevibacter albus TaxID=1473156 RepID=A0AA37S7X6_9GAMM|nr:LysR family transcriptional regulator [Litoribrevibacter albus]GLQ29957.1 LysR family transcriptional regulator [Litoribrevibacter albus]